MTVKNFRKKLEKIIEESGEFVTYSNEDPNFKELEDNNLAILGEAESDVFAITIIKVKI